MYVFTKCYPYVLLSDSIKPCLGVSGTFKPVLRQKMYQYCFPLLRIALETPGLVVTQ